MSVPKHCIATYEYFVNFFYSIVKCLNYIFIRGFCLPTILFHSSRVLLVLLVQCHALIGK